MTAYAGHTPARRIARVVAATALGCVVASFLPASARANESHHRSTKMWLAAAVKLLRRGAFARDTTCTAGSAAWVRLRHGRGQPTACTLACLRLLRCPLGARTSYHRSTPTRQMQLAAAQKLLPPSAMARGIPYIAAREVQGRLLAGLGQQCDRVLVSSFAGVHTALGDIQSRAAYTTACEAPTAAQLIGSGGKSAGRNNCARCSAANRNGCRCSAARSCNSLRLLPASDR